MIFMKIVCIPLVFHFGYWLHSGCLLGAYCNKQSWLLTVCLSVAYCLLTDYLLPTYSFILLHTLRPCPTQSCWELFACLAAWWDSNEISNFKWFLWNPLIDDPRLSRYLWFSMLLVLEASCSRGFLFSMLLVLDTSCPRCFFLSVYLIPGASYSRGIPLSMYPAHYQAHLPKST